MDPRARVVAIVLAAVLAAAGGYAIGMATDDDSSSGAQIQEVERRPGEAAPLRPSSSTGAAEEYELSPTIKRDDSGG